MEDKKGFSWMIKKWKYFNKADMPACAQLELLTIYWRLEKLDPR